jgi:hypothetical protein
MPFPEWTPPRVSDEPTAPGWGPAGDLRRSMEVLGRAPPTPQEQRITDLEAALRALVEIEPVFRNHHGYWACLRCEALLPITSGDPVGFRHAPDCPVTVARALLPPEG